MKKATPDPLTELPPRPQRQITPLGAEAQRYASEARRIGRANRRRLRRISLGA